jgi:hypothetical protein
MKIMLNRDEADPGSGVTPYDRLAFAAEAVSRWLARGERATELRLLFGDAAHAELSALAVAAAAARRVRSAPAVWIVPGIMGSQLSVRRGHGLPPDVLWLDALDIIVGRMVRLRVGAEPRLRASGVLLPSYLPLGLRLRAAGFAPRFFAYDWRLDVARNGKRLAAALRRAGQTCGIVAHSLGGLVVRAALTAARLPPIERVVLLGVPHHGSYAAVQALRGSYTVVRKLAMLDAHHDAPTLSRRVFTSFASLHELLPSGPLASDCDFFDGRQWPDEGPRPELALLTRARGLEHRLAPLDARCVGIAGIGRPTIRAAALSADRREFRYSADNMGDGTVPLESARGATADGYLTTVAHSDMARDASVAEAVVDLLREGRTQRLAPWRGADAIAGRGRPMNEVTDTALLRDAQRKVDWHAMNADQRRSFLERLNDISDLGTATDVP